MRKFAGVMIAVVLCLPFLGWTTARVVQSVMFNRNVAGHLKRAADANTIGLAEKELAVAISYLKENGMTSGYTSVWYTTPDEDIGFWYQNLIASIDELHKVKPEATQLEISNILIKLRETLVDHGQSLSVTVPEGASVFPHNTAYFWWAISSLVIGIVGMIVGLVVANNDSRY